MSDSEPISDEIERASNIWKSFSSRTDHRLWRLALLRDFSLSLHASHSRRLAQESTPPTPVQNWRQIEARIERVREWRGSELSQELEAWLGQEPETEQLTPAVNALPEKLGSKLDLKKFERPDRRWEKSLLLEALQLGWSLWFMEASPDPPEAQEFHSRVVDRARAHGGIVLLVESAPPTPSEMWRGRWMIITPPELLDPSQLIIPGDPRIQRTWARIFP